MAQWTFLLWFELPSDLDVADEAAQFLSSEARQLLLERLFREEDRWILHRARMGNPVGHGENQSWIVFIPAEGQSSIRVEAMLREQEPA